MMKLAVIVPYRNRAQHLELFAPHMKQNVDCDIYVIEQADDKPFNRAKLFNVGIIETHEIEDYYYCFHDVDMLTVTGDYRFPAFPTHIATKCSQYGYTMPFRTYFGGVTLFNLQDLITLRGFSNKFWGWGAEDDEMIAHIKRNRMRIDRRYCVFECFTHEWNMQPKQFAINNQLAQKQRLKDDGLFNTFYKVVGREQFPDYILIKVLL